jgi:hypothetical protein
MTTSIFEPQMTSGAYEYRLRNTARTSMIEAQTPKVEGVSVAEDTLKVEFSDRSTISLPLAWYPRLVHATQDERDNWELIGEGQGIHWPDLDEDLSAEGLIFRRSSGESRRSFERWLEAKGAGRSVLLYDLTHAEQSKEESGP